MISDVKISRQALKELKRAPHYIQEKFRAWLVAVHDVGLMRVRVRPGWHDEPLYGSRKGQRSIRLNRLWRAIYIIKSNGEIEFVEIIEVMPHDY